LMRINGIRSKRKRKFKVTTHSKHNRALAANLIQRNFTASIPLPTYALKKVGYILRFSLMYARVALWAGP
jgi:hypothetical protein